MNKEIIMKISAIIVSAITIYTVIIWQPKDNGEVVEENLNNIKDVLDNKENADNSIFQIDQLNLPNNSSDKAMDNGKNSTEGLGAIVIKEKTFDEIINKIDSKEKEEINDVLKKLSIIDCSKIDNFLSQDDNSKGLNDAFQFIRKRLSSEDYDRFQQILSKYIDFTNINSNL
jgi:hypothetical protein